MVQHHQCHICTMVRTLAWSQQSCFVPPTYHSDRNCNIGSKGAKKVIFIHLNLGQNGKINCNFPHWKNGKRGGRAGETEKDLH
ncbi:hypothetical protein AMEX_G17941 [Astyanax mexicanus]|uniref:Uncharacterized protein n=1 Tax=Astyanax mexicanus TaxID=7994 RepID=A0A8T2LJ69_ASTMX|nr:hypothetical protein AMEX_G17941 [Astyanax mexicanus]